MDKFMTFNIEEGNYEMLIKELRKRLPQSRTKNGGLVVMPHVGQPWNWLDVELIANHRSITLRLDSRTLYVCGYRRMYDGPFWEFNDMEFPLISGSKSLGYAGSYAGLGFDSVVPEHLPLDKNLLLGLTDTAHTERQNLELGYHALKDAIITLAEMENPDLECEVSAKSLLVMIQMITEAARIELVGNHMVDTWWKPEPINLRMVELQNAWGTTCSPDITYCTNAFVLVSVEHVRLKSINGESPVEVHGTVKVAYGRARRTVYNRSLDNPESKGLGDYISLIGSSIFWADGFTICVRLWDHDNEIANGDIVWNPQFFPLIRRPLSIYNVLRVQDVRGKCGEVSVSYTVLNVAFNATAKVLVHGDSNVNVYGTIKAMIEGSPYQSWRMLFDKSEDECVQVRCPEEFIPLARPEFPVPVHAYITIQADLRDRGRLPPHNLIARGSVRFIPTTGTHMKKCGGVDVIIVCD